MALAVQYKIRRKLMAQIITNQASLNYQYNGQTASALSNIASATLEDALGAEKVSVESVYRYGDELTYSVNFTNSSGTALTNVTVTDDLGSYTVGANTLTPLTFVPPALLFIDGTSAGNITPTVNANSIVFTIPTLASGARAQILYKAVANTSAPLATNSFITNTATVAANGITESVTADSTVTVDNYADVTITKAMTPSSVVSGDVITYTFVINNYGNAEATNIVLSDSFNPAPDNITVSVNGTVVPATDYTYTGGVLTLPSGTTGYTLSLPPATITQDSATGAVSVTPSSITVTVTGTIV